MRQIQHFAYKHRCHLFIRTHNGYIKCRRIHHQQYEETSTYLNSTDLPVQAKPVELEMLTPNRWQIHHVTHIIDQSLRPRSWANESFEQYLKSLDVLEYDLLRHSKLFADPFPINWEHEEGFYTGSDGSQKYSTDGAFGWMISKRAGKRTATGMGPARGLCMDSYQAECCGMLSGHRFLIRLGEYTHRTDEWTGIVGTDSQSMLEKLFGKQNLREHSALGAVQLQNLDVLTAEWDLLIEIQNSLRALNGVNLQYVKGHQDDVREYTSLPLLAQLNVDADDKAKEFQREYGKAHPTVLMSPATGVHLLFPEGTVTAKYISEMRHQSTGPPLQEHIRMKNDGRKPRWRISIGTHTRKHSEHKSQGGYT
jgi:hypothetical protein